MKGAAFEIGVELDLLKTTRCPEALLVACGHVDRRTTAFGPRFGALEDDNVSGHVDKGVGSSARAAIIGSFLGFTNKFYSSSSADPSDSFSSRPKREVTAARERPEACSASSIS